MAGTVEHLVIADRLLDKLHIPNPALFYCGNLAPDAIMARENYVRDMKTHTHFKDGQEPYELRLEQNREIYLERLQAFVDCFFTDEYVGRRDLFLGYLVHILADEIYLLEYYEEFVTDLYASGSTPADLEFSRNFVHDVDQVDWELVRTYEFKHPMPDILWQEDGYEIPGWITAQELLSSKKYIIYKNFQTEHVKEPLRVTTMEKNYAFLDKCIEKIPVIMRERYGLEP